VNQQEDFWVGEFGTEYTARNDRRPLEVVGIWSRMLARAYGGVSSAIELSANIGLNLQAISALLPNCKLSAVEINKTAFDRLSSLGNVNAVHSSIFDFKTAETFDLSFTSGVLIHLAPERINDAYAKLYSLSRRYVLVSEYYNPVPVSHSLSGSQRAAVQTGLGR
jgi:pseudaminic acid biosynthesis-associated methylase